VIAALEAGELVLKPDVVEMSSPCQGRSIARSLAEWSEEQHPHHDLWFLQPKLISLLQPRVVLIAN
jgi:site-specific DNA-cytosine methylase